MLKHTMVLKSGQFIGRPTRMGKKIVIIIPTEYHDEIEKVLNDMLKVSWEQIIERDGKSRKSGS